MLSIKVFLEKLVGSKIVVVLIFLESNKVRHFTWKRRYVCNISHVCNISPFLVYEIQI